MDRPRPNWSAIESVVGDLHKSLDNMGDMHRKLMRVTGTAWSSDRLVKAVVGPRGQLVELEIDPRVYRQPNSKALAAKIVATVHSAVDDVLRQTSEILDENLPSDRGLGFGLSLDNPAVRLARRHDADVLKEMSADDE